MTNSKKSLRNFATKAFGLTILVMAFYCFSNTRDACSSERIELLRYEVTWNGQKAGHGDITSVRNSKQINVTAQAVSDGVLKSIIELWSRIQATFHAKTFQPQTYRFHLKSNLGRPEIVDLLFDHNTNLVQVNKQRGDERENHAERFQGICDPITAAYRLRYQKDLSKPMYVDIYDGKDKSRLFVNPIGNEYLTLKTGVHPAISINLKLVRLGGDGRELATGKLWVSNDQYRIPLLLTSSPSGRHYSL